MKSKLVVGFLCCVLILGILPLNFIPSVSAGYTSDSWSENFENQNFDKWDSNTGFTISSEQAHGGSYSAKVVSDGWESIKLLKTWQKLNLTDVSIEYYMYIDVFEFTDASWLASLVATNDIHYSGSYYFGRLKLQQLFGGNQPYIWQGRDTDPPVFDWSASNLRYLEEDVWTKMNVTISIDPDNDNATVSTIYINDVPTTPGGGINYYTRFNRLFFEGQISGSEDAEFTMYIDDVVVLGIDVGYEFNVSAILEDVDDDGADWVFTDWKYYDFTVYTNFPMVNCSISFLLDVGVENVWVSFYSDASNWVYASNQSYVTRYGEPCQLKAGTWSYNGTSFYYTVTFGIFFHDTIVDLWDASDGVDVYGTYNSSAPFLVNENYFRIYSKGGFTLNAESSDATYAWIIDGGTPFSFHVGDDGGSINQWMYNEIWSRDIQHMKLMPDIYFLAGREAFTIKYGVDYSIGDGEWLTGWWLNIQPDFVSYTGVFAANVWINMTTTYNDRLEVARMAEAQYMFYHGSVSGAGDPGHFKLWADLWFSDKNASGVGSARINAYEFPMIDNADLWLRWLANNWGVKDDVDKELQGASSLWDASNETMSSEGIKMVRFWSNITVYSAGAGQTIEVRNFEAFDSTHSNQLPLTGVSSPVFDETITPTVGAKGILGALWSMFAGFGSWLSENVIFGGLNMWGVFVAFLDSIAGMFGAPTFFSDLFTWISEMIVYLADSVGYVATIASDLFSLIGALLGAFLTTMGDLISSLVTSLTFFSDMMSGVYGGGVDLWEAFNISQWITVAMIFYPLYLIILWDQKGLDPVIEQLTLIFGLLVWLFGFFVQLIQFVIGLITAVIESIPVAE